MARMYPSKLTEAFSGFNVPAERSLYEKLSRELPDDYHVFHDVVWDDPSLDAGLLLREIKSSRSHESLLDWIAKREFLPKLGVDYQVEEFSLKYGPNSLTINGAKMMASDEKDHES